MQTYVTVMRPVLEYASEVWDGCFILETEILEKKSSTRNSKNNSRSTGLPLFASRNAIYLETGLATVCVCVCVCVCMCVCLK